MGSSITRKLTRNMSVLIYVGAGNPNGMNINTKMNAF